MRKLDISKEVLYDLYVNKELMLSEIAERLGCAESSISNYLKKYYIGKNDKYIGRKFGKLTVIDNGGLDKGRRTKWICKCDCGNIVSVVGYDLRAGNTKTCGCSRTTVGNKHPAFKGYEEISGAYWANVKRAAKDRDLEFTLTLKYVWELFLKQNRKCSLSGMDIWFSRSNSIYERTASLDRIDSNIGYLEYNVQWVHKDINRMKQAFNQEYFIRLCELVANKG